MLHIRVATVDDASAIAMIHIDSWRYAYQDIFPKKIISQLSFEKREVYWRDSLAKKEFHTILAESSAGIIGWASFGLDRDSPDNTEAGELHAIYVSPASLFSGTGKALLAQVETVLRAEGRKFICVGVLKKNLPALRFYTSLNFRHLKEKTIERGGEEFEELVLKKII